MTPFSLQPTPWVPFAFIAPNSGLCFLSSVGLLNCSWAPPTYAVMRKLSSMSGCWACFMCFLLSEIAVHHLWSHTQKPLCHTLCSCLQLFIVKGNPGLCYSTMAIHDISVLKIFLCSNSLNNSVRAGYYPHESQVKNGGLK